MNTNSVIIFKQKDAINIKKFRITKNLKAFDKWGSFKTPIFKEINKILVIAINTMVKHKFDNPIPSLSPINLKYIIALYILRIISIVIKSFLFKEDQTESYLKIIGIICVFLFNHIISFDLTWICKKKEEENFPLAYQPNDSKDFIDVK